MRFPKAPLLLVTLLLKLALGPRASMVALAWMLALLESSAILDVISQYYTRMAECAPAPLWGGGPCRAAALSNQSNRGKLS
jgi:hypothetical protein